jgi:hypothetical protein
MVNQHAYGVAAAHSPVFYYRESKSGDVSAAYRESFERVWLSARSL